MKQEVLQVTILGPLLFPLHINNIQSSTHEDCNIVKYDVGTIKYTNIKNLDIAKTR